MRCKSIGITVALIATVLLSFTIVQAIPVPPHQFYGTATLDGETIEDDLIVKAKINSIVYGSSVTDNGKYGYAPLLKVKTDDSATIEKEGGANGETVEFYIGILKASETFIFSDSTVTELTLAFESICGDDDCNGNEDEITCPEDCKAPVPEPYCGDGDCNGDETYSSCSQDCEAPSTTSAPISSGGGSSSKTTEVVVSTPKVMYFGDKTEMTEESSSKLTLRGETHTIQVATITKSSATIMIYSSPVELTLKIGESKEVDITEDDILDIKVTLDNILNKKAYITIIELEQPEKKEQVSVLPKERVESESVTSAAGKGITGLAIGRGATSITPINILIASGLIVIAVVIALFGRRAYNIRKKKNRRKK